MRRSERGGRSERVVKWMGEMRGGEVLMFFFFKQKTAYEIYQCDWSSDVCSSDLEDMLQILFAGNAIRLLLSLPAKVQVWE